MTERRDELPPMYHPPRGQSRWKRWAIMLAIPLFGFLVLTVLL